MRLLPDTSVLIPYFTRNAYASDIDRALRAGRFVICSVVAEEVLAGARDQGERQDYDRFFGLARRSGGSATPSDEDWRRCGHLLSRYRQRFGSLASRDHQNDVLIVLTALALARTTQTVLMTENDADLNVWLTMAGNKGGLRIDAVRR